MDGLLVGYLVPAGVGASILAAIHLRFRLSGRGMGRLWKVAVIVCCWGAALSADLLALSGLVGTAPPFPLQPALLFELVMLFTLGHLASSVLGSRGQVLVLAAVGAGALGEALVQPVFPALTGMLLYAALLGGIAVEKWKAGGLRHPLSRHSGAA